LAFELPKIKIWNGGKIERRELPLWCSDQYNATLGPYIKTIPLRIA
jgi:hypothetical protein